MSLNYFGGMSAIYALEKMFEKRDNPAAAVNVPTIVKRERVHAIVRLRKPISRRLYTVKAYTHMQPSKWYVMRFRPLIRLNGERHV